MKDVLILDTETTGVDPKRHFVVEVGAVLWSLEHHTTLVSYSSLVGNGPNEAEAINGIPSAALVGAPPVDRVLRDLRNLVARADAIVAHFAEFDRGFLPIEGKPWICTGEDVTWPRPSSSKSLVNIALAHGLGVSSAHRALTDCRIIARLLERCHELGHDVNALLERGLRPKAKFIVAERDFDPKRNELAKGLGFRWEPETKTWARTMAIEDAASLPFAVKQAARVAESGT